MKSDFASRFTGGSFVAAALMLVLGWWLLPVHIGRIGYVAGTVGFSAMALTMGLPDHLSYYLPIFHAMVAWLLATGVVLYCCGVNLTPPPA